MRRVLLTFFFFSIHLTPQSAVAEVYGSGWYREVQLAIGQEDNLARSYKAIDSFDDVITTGSLGIGFSKKLGDNMQYVAGGYVSYSQYDEFDDLSNTAISLNGTLIWQPEASYRKPWYRVAGEITRLDYKDSIAREGYLATLSFSANRRLGMRTIGRMGYRYLDFIFDVDDVLANKYAAFDVARHEFFAGMDYHLAGDTWLTIDYSYQHGGFTSSSSISPGEIEYDAETEDPAFESCSVIRCVPFYAYRTIADVHSVDAAITFVAFGVDMDLSVRYLDARPENDLSYDNWFAQIGAIWTF